MVTPVSTVFMATTMTFLPAAWPRVKHVAFCRLAFPVTCKQECPWVVLQIHGYPFNTSTSLASHNVAFSCFLNYTVMSFEGWQIGWWFILSCVKKSISGPFTNVGFLMFFQQYNWYYLNSKMKDVTTHVLGFQSAGHIY